MPMVVWSEKFMTGNPGVDRQHQELFDMVNRLHRAIIDGTGKDALVKTLDGLAHYAATHFKAEESLMVQNAYPGYHEYKAKHDELTAETRDVIAGYKAGRNTLPVTLSRFLGEWIQRHIEGEDIKMIAYVRNR